MAEERKPLSLNERNQRLLLGLSRSRTSKPPSSPPNHRTEIRVRKVKLDGRRRLCKLSSPSSTAAGETLDDDLFDSPVQQKENKVGCGDTLADLTSMMESLSVEKPKPRPRPVIEVPEAVVEFESASSSLSTPGDTKVVLPMGKALDLDDEEEDCVVLGSNGKEKVQKEEGIDGVDDDADGEDIVMDGTGISKSRRYVLSGETAKMLYPHQRDGLKWFWGLHCGGTGGILGDDMGLGKTMQVAAFLAGLFRSRLIKRALIVAPKTLLAHWTKELSVVGLSEKIRDYSGASAKAREYELRDVLKEGGVLLTTYDIVRNNFKSIRGDLYVYGGRSEEELIWDYVVLDEGHIIKNPSTQRAKSLSEIPSAHRIIISGTPIQNNLKELWALFHFCCPAILGDKDEFKMKYEKKILAGNDKNASAREKHVGSTVAKELRERIKPYFLRRMKSEVFREDDTTKSAKLSKKNEIIVWLRLTTCQRQLYEAFLKSEWVHSSLDGGSPLAALTILKKICDHPLLLTKKAAEGVLEGMDTMLNHEELGMVEKMAQNLANMTGQVVQQLDHNVSCKISFIMSLLENLVLEGHIVLIFSQTRKMLNLIQEAIISADLKFLRIDGTTKITDREKIVKDFQEGPGAPIFLLTSQVGGLGLTLTKADRVIVVDPAWNPSTDNQSVDRAYRIGQSRDVLVYRLMTCGTIEEKIYKMQVFKGGLFRTATEQKDQMRYFNQRDIREVFSLPKQGFDISLTQQQMLEEHDQQHKMDDSLKNHIDFLQRLGIAGVSHHSLLFSKTETVPVVSEDAEVQRKPRYVPNSSSSGVSIERVVDGAEFAFNPKDKGKFSPKEFHAKVPPGEAMDDAEWIEEKIKRLSQTLANKELVSRLSDNGERIRKQIDELRKRLEDIHDSVPEIIDLDELTKGIQEVVSIK
ncbi:protein CHROMATIN REMODELING 24 [Iris pallida]|uniref:Protein CHROMATIN REMODELING 24 n=1 Tax=Iris pallida TaxID=29817 RepID=A0AAX6E346_IRIPA|nr:protein CHROMATIN REMODELING 24 [Iris pallida]